MTPSTVDVAPSIYDEATDVVKAERKESEMTISTVDVAPSIYDEATEVVKAERKNSEMTVSSVDVAPSIYDEATDVVKAESIESEMTVSTAAAAPGIYDKATDVVKAEWNEMSRRVAQVRVTREMVCHRGFHSFEEVPDLPLRIKREPWGLSRPLENTIAAFAAIWSMGPNLCECDIILTADGELVLFHDDTLERFRETTEESLAKVRTRDVMPEDVGHTDSLLKPLHEQTLEEVQNLTSPNGPDSAFSGDWALSKMSGGPLVDYRRLLLPGASDADLKNWVLIPTLADVLKVAKSMSTADNLKKLVVEIKADLNTARSKGSAMANWVKANLDLANHIAVIMSFAEGVLEGYHDQGAPHGPEEDKISLMLCTVKAEDASLLYQEDKVCYSGGGWAHTDGWDAVPAHVDGYYMEVNIMKQLWWSHVVKAKCEKPPTLSGKAVVLGGWMWADDPHRVPGYFPSKKLDVHAKQFMTMPAADVEKSLDFLVHKMGFSFVNTDFAPLFDAAGYVTLQNEDTGEMEHRPVEMF